MFSITRLFAILVLCFADAPLAGHPAVVPLAKDVSQGRRIVHAGRERWSYILAPGAELRFPGEARRGQALVWSGALLTGCLPSEPMLEFCWRDEKGRESDLLRWPGHADSSANWYDFRVPLTTAGKGAMVARWVGGWVCCDSFALVAPRLENARVRSSPTHGMPSIVMVVFDTFRFDHISRYGSTLAQTPHIDRFLSESREFMEAYTRTTYTLPSHVTMFTGLTPRVHGIRKNLQVVPSDVTAIHQLLYGAGYRTGAFFEIAALKEPSGFPIGFDSYVECIKTKGWTLDRISAWLQTVNEEPFFLFINLSTVHVARTLPHDICRLECGLPRGPAYRLTADSDLETVNVVLPPGDTALRFHAGSFSTGCDTRDDDVLSMAIWDVRVTPGPQVSLSWAEDVQRPKKVEYLVFPPQWKEGDIVFSDDTEATLHNSTPDTVLATLKFRAYPDFYHAVDQDRQQYAGAVAALDSIFGALVAMVEQTVNPREVLWIVTADHGEGLEYHRDRLHGHEVYDETAHVPLAIRAASVRAGRIRGLVPLDCIAPTVLALAGIEQPTAMPSRSLLGKGFKPATTLISEAFYEKHATSPEPLADAQAIRTPQWSCVLDHVQQLVHLYDRVNDQVEMHDVALEHPSTVDGLLELLRDSVKNTQTKHAPGMTSSDSTLVRALSALGYVE
ncbi:sulfatase-like hydrolase/transferase [Candidatus Fermentibacteria bacterium]|nr:sulfatase-like hydrolase/transferase [Candidatus Fermentibacteria bacterium]